MPRIAVEIGPALLGLLWLAGGLGVTAPVDAADAADAAEPVRSPAAGAAPLDAYLDDAEDPDDPSVTRRKQWGLMFDLGSMQGGMLSLLYRPTSWLRLHAGAGTNAVSAGYRAGVTIARAAGGPSLNIEGGHFLPGDMNGLLKILVGTGYDANPRLEHFDYDFINLHVGWEVESGNLTFFARGGVSVLLTTIPALPRVDAASAVSSTSDTEPFSLVLPSVAFGFIGFL